MCFVCFFCFFFILNEFNLEFILIIINDTCPQFLEPKATHSNCLLFLTNGPELIHFIIIYNNARQKILTFETKLFFCCVFFVWRELNRKNNKLIINIVAI